MISNVAKASFKLKLHEIENWHGSPANKLHVDAELTFRYYTSSNCEYQPASGDQHVDSLSLSREMQKML